MEGFNVEIFMSIFAYSGCQSFFFSYSGVTVSPLVSEKSSGIQDNFHFERVDILQGPVEVCPEIYEPLALYVWTGQVHVVWDWQVAYNFKTG